MRDNSFPIHNQSAIWYNAGGMADIYNDFMEDNEFDTILSPDIDFTGTLHFEKPFLIRGKVSGEINASGLLVIDENAVVNANIHALRVLIRGQVKGDVTAVEKVEVTVTGKLSGNVTAPEIYMETGCVFNGRCTMIGKDHL
jgi:cytoskeletal protein CcmA (bactofilin family)